MEAFLVWRKRTLIDTT